MYKYFFIFLSIGLLSSCQPKTPRSFYAMYAQAQQANQYLWLNLNYGNTPLITDQIKEYKASGQAAKEDFILQHIKVGDQIEIELSRLVGFPATVHKVTEDKIMIIFDDYVAAKPMNEPDTNDGGFEKSDLYKWLHTDFVKLLPASLRERIIDVTIPSVGEMFSWGDKWNREHFEPDGDEQLPLMVYRRNRVAYFDNEISRGWLRNAIKKECSSAGFAFVGDGGNLGYRYASRSYGVRPVIWLVK